MQRKVESLNKADQGSHTPMSIVQMLRLHISGRYLKPKDLQFRRSLEFGQLVDRTIKCAQGNDFLQIYGTEFC